MVGRMLTLVVALVAAGCLSPTNALEPAEGTALVDELPLRVDPSRYTELHDYEGLTAVVHAWAEDHPDLVTLRSIGTSHRGRDVWLAIITDPASTGDKTVGFIDGGHHGMERAGIEQVLYFGDHVLLNRDHPSIADLLQKTELWLVPVVNPDGMAQHASGCIVLCEGPRIEPAGRGNAHGVNLNRNYDVDWGNPLGGENVFMGQVVNETGVHLPSGGGPALENPGAYPLSEPESQAVAAALAEAGDRLAYYVSMHTSVGSVSRSFAAYEPPFEIPEQELTVMEEVLQWVRDNTEFIAGTMGWGDTSAGLPYSGSGTSMDWAYVAHDVPSFTFEQVTAETAVESDHYLDYATCMKDIPPDHWMAAGLPFLLFLAVNHAELDQWQSPTVAPVLPEGVPPEPYCGGADARAAAAAEAGLPPGPWY